MKQAFLILAVVSAFITSCDKDDDPQVQTPTLTQDEINDLIFLREEEKLAHDVYIFSFNKYNEQIFENIASSELQHTSTVLDLLEKYDLEDPVGNNAEGVFTNTVLQSLYDQLTLTSDSSLNHALTVGALIEDLDINDIENSKGRTDKSDILNVYDKLQCGSRNHLRSFVGRLGSYEPTYLSQTEFDDIINSSNEKCGQ